MTIARRSWHISAASRNYTYFCTRIAIRVRNLRAYRVGDKIRFNGFVIRNSSETYMSVQEGQRRILQANRKRSETMCWQHATTLRHKWKSLTENQTVIFIVGVLALVLGVPGTYFSYRGWHDLPKPKGDLEKPTANLTSIPPAAVPPSAKDTTPTTTPSLTPLAHKPPPRSNTRTKHRQLNRSPRMCA